MNIASEIDELINAVKEKCPNVMIFQETGFGEKPFESGVWKFWLQDNEEVYLHIEVLNGMLWALYANKTFENKHPIEATKICNYLENI